jgi:hypothetical protein
VSLAPLLLGTFALSISPVEGRGNAKGGNSPDQQKEPIRRGRSVGPGCFSKAGEGITASWT